MDTLLEATPARTEQPAPSASGDILVPHVIRGKVHIGREVEYRSRDMGANFYTPRIDLDELVWTRDQPGPAFNMPIGEIIDFLVELGTKLNLDTNAYLQEALRATVNVNPLGPRIVENCYRDMANMFDRNIIETELDVSLGGRDTIDGWHGREIRGKKSRLRAFPPRLVHILAGNSPMVCAMTIMRAAITKGVHLLKLPSNDLFTTSAILRTMADMAPDHPVTQSFSTVYWRGGDEKLESIIYRPQYFDKLIVWGGESAVRHVLRYIGPGLELIAFDPKVSMSLVGKEAFSSEASLKDAARRGASDVLSFNQDACNASRYQFVEGSVEEVDRYAAALAEALGHDVRYGAGCGPTVPQDIRDEVEMLRELEPVYRVFGEYGGRGLVIRSDEMVDFHPTGKTVNVICVNSLADGARQANVATQTVGIYPPARAVEVRDILACAGVQRIVALGDAISDGVGGYPHDAMFPVHRCMKWISEEASDA